MGMLNWLMSPRGLATDRWCVKYLGVSPLNHVFARQGGFKARPALLLETVGRKSGVLRPVVLPYYELEGRLFVVGSKGGAPKDPYWVENLRAWAYVSIRKRRKKISVQARVLSPEERRPIWEAICELMPVYRQYQQSTDRQIPVVELQPQG
ncbi:nitroreductase family deazaflavin-dependent oxidoreductase [Pseudomaricurvus alkylphenolicus]|uniref:nitroreductase family deazaflavin-dependent oxidoreductase n=1 Tax=Pseudomaricurvus alkylphenolicus TaxID=1306991 RepID=UPI00141DF9CC|nr:nitroreductase family deazaflavin-dependent oxidoreductase [Pseudomaricurvus alkylphenolicus]NIB37995.1 nitroreductase family deazaflavin-dependent oxidoreductase [Pseudomaricurvus alkylphenolicus]